MLAWPFSGRKDRTPTILTSVDSGYETASLSAASGESQASTGPGGRSSEPAIKPLKRAPKRVPKDQLEKLKGFKLTFGRPLIQYVRARPSQKGQHQALLIDMKYLGESADDARLTIIISCHPAYEKTIKSFLREHRVSIDSFFRPGGTADDPSEIVHLLIHPMSPTALAKVLCQQPDHKPAGLQLVGERLAYQSEDGFHEATFGGFVAVSYDIGRWSVFGLTTAHQAGWELDQHGTYSVISHIRHVDGQLAEIQGMPDLGPSREIVPGLRSSLQRWARFEIEPVQGLQSGEYVEYRQKYTSAARSLLNRCQCLAKQLRAYRSVDANAAEDDEDDSSGWAEEQYADVLSDGDSYTEKIAQFLKRHEPFHGRQALASDTDQIRHDEELWDSYRKANFDSLEETWRVVHKLDMLDDTMLDEMTGAGDVIAQSTDTPIAPDFANHDWALIRIPELDKGLAAAVASPGARTLRPFQPSEMGKEEWGAESTLQLMLLNSGHSFAQADCDTGFSFVCIPPSKDFVEVIAMPTEEFGADIGKGDSGSWVLDKSGQVMGHIVAKDTFGETLVMPMAGILQDIKKRLNVEVVDIPFEPVNKAIADGLAHLPAIGDRVDAARRGPLAIFQTTFDRLSLHLDDGGSDPFNVMQGRRNEARLKWEAARQEWKGNTQEYDLLSRAYDSTRDWLGQDRLAAALDYHWTVQEAYQRKVSEDQRGEDTVRWSEQRARWAYQDGLWDNRNQHWTLDWWVAYLRKWNSDLDAWATANERLKAQIDAFRRCLELLQLHFPVPSSLDPRPLSITPSSTVSRQRDDLLTGVSPRWSLSQRPPLSLAPLTRHRVASVSNGGSMDSGYGSRSASPSVASSCDTTSLRPPRYGRRRGQDAPAGLVGGLPRSEPRRQAPAKEGPDDYSIPWEDHGIFAFW